ncbi:hypothetical protein PMI13_04161 [Chryseobacterium populi]|uniref:Uncharacterized protein n=1 Tax=Chryseobacterium populi TaxID=1144316 RepID=J2SPP9_9FLAO|nr:hypothetical protein PMI13_04161 [Chryseobacterium populi]
MRNTVYTITSCVSVIVAIFLIYDLIMELNHGMSVFEIDLIPFLTALIIVANGVMASLLLLGKIKPRRPLLIFQILVVIPTCLLLYDIAFNSTVSCT